MKVLEKIILAAGLATMAYLLYKLDASSIWANVAHIGLGLPLILILPVPDHFLNALGWKFSFSSQDARPLRLWKLMLIRIAGDGVNYLTPSATIAGEVVRPAMLEAAAPAEAKIASVVVARFTQSVGQALFIMIGLIIVVTGKIPAIEGLPLIHFIRRWFFIPNTILVLTLALIGGYMIKTWKRKPGQNRSPSPDAERPSKWMGVRKQIGFYLLEHPGRFTLSTIFFTAGYFYSTIEVFAICHFMNVPISPAVALAIEVLSSIVDGVLFMVPAKIGTQEAGKTAIFTGLGLQPAQGFAFGVIRHIRELVWAGLGFSIYALQKKKNP